MILLRCIYTLLLLILFAILFDSYPYMDKNIMLFILGIVIFVMVSFSLYKEKNINLRGQLIKHSTLFLFGYLIVHFQYYLDYILGYIDSSLNIIWFDQSIIIKSFALSAIGLISFLLGYTLVKDKKIKINLKTENLGTNLIQLLSLLSLLVFYATVDPRYLLGYYNSNISPTANYAQFGFQVFTFAVIIQNSRNLYSYKLKNNTNINFKDYIIGQGILFTIMIAIYLFSVLLSGDRGPLISMGLIYIAGYLFVTKIKFKKYIIIGGIFFSAIFITLLGQVRLMDKNIPFIERLIMAYNGEGTNSTFLESKSISPQTKELGSSVKALHVAVSSVPKKNDYFYGRLQLQFILGTIPFGTEFKRLLFEDNSYKTTGSGNFITWVVLGENPYYGLGTTCVADLYLDLDFLGVLIGMFIFGILIRKSELALFEEQIPSLFLQVFSFVYLAFSLYIPRSMLLFNLKICVFIFIVLIFNKYIINYKKIKV